MIQSLVENKNLTSFDFEVFKSNGLVSKKSDRIKVLGRGELKSTVAVKAHAFSASAQKAIESIGGTIAKL